MSEPLKIWFQKHTIAGRVPELDAAYTRLDGLAERLGATLETHTLPAAVYSQPLPAGYVRYGAIEELFATYFAHRAVEADERGFDVFVIATSQDPGLQMARRLASIPCVGYGETSLRLAQMFTDRIGVVGFIPELEAPIRRNYEEYGLGRATVHFEYTGVEPEVIAAAFAGDDALFLDRFREAVGRCVAAGAEIVIPGEGLPNELVVRAGLTEVDGVPIVDSNAAVVREAVRVGAMVAAGEIARPGRSYWNARPPAETFRHLRDVLGPW